MDNQKCTIEIAHDRNDVPSATLIPGTLNFEDSNVKQYIISDWKLEETVENRIVIYIYLERQRIYFLMSIILPIVLINVVGTILK